MLLILLLSSLLPVTLSLSCNENVTSIELCKERNLLSEAQQPITAARAPAMYRYRSDYGVDVSWPMQYPWLSQHYKGLKYAPTIAEDESSRRINESPPPPFDRK